MIRIYNVLIGVFHYVCLLKSQINLVPKIEYEYKVVSKIDSEKISIKLRPVLSQIKIGEMISTKSFFDKNKSILSFKSKEYGKNIISNAFIVKALDI